MEWNSFKLTRVFLFPEEKAYTDMELKEIIQSRSPLRNDWVRISGKVLYEDGKDSPDIFWFDIPEAYQDEITSSGNPWLVCMLPLAMKLGEPIRFPLPVDSVLHENIIELMEIWDAWFPDLNRIPLEIEAHQNSRRQGISQTGVFFSRERKVPR